MGFFSDLVDGFTGKAQQRDITAASAKATSALGQGRDNAMTDYRAAQGMFNPYAQQGGRANALYGDALGVNGADARSAATANFAQTNPYSQQGDDYAMRGVQRAMNARGQGTNSGNALLAAQRVGSERFDQRYNNWMGQLQGAGQQGLQATSAQAGLQQGMGDLNYGYGQQLAGNAINQGNAMAGTRNILGQNLMNVAGLGIGAMGGGFGGMGGAANGLANHVSGNSVNRLFGGFGRSTNGGV